MKVTVLKEFRDKHTRVVYRPGMELEFSNERVKEVTKNLPGFITAIRDEPRAPEAPISKKKAKK